MHVSTSRLIKEHIANVFNDLKQCRFLVFVELFEFFNHFNVLLIMYYLRQFFIIKLNEQIDLTFNFEVRKIFNVARVINISFIR